MAAPAAAANSLTASAWCSCRVSLAAASGTVPTALSALRRALLATTVAVSSPSCSSSTRASRGAEAVATILSSPAEALGLALPLSWWMATLSCRLSASFSTASVCRGSL